ncbi:hypothetical protein T11_2282 [Trichinella zimbabwensis]|uniref:Uncharacterized protein n=1 Tax=Trichinella zimbabwensis TaxID=268475 RepID=A0A0V1I7Q9_9BILA|nr:hypothetical protein T11_2282 [Trichinella zimbabwensis]
MLRERGQNVNPDCDDRRTMMKRNLSCHPSLVGRVRKMSTLAESRHQRCSTPQMFLSNMEPKSWLARLEDFLRLRGIPPLE